MEEKTSVNIKWNYINLYLVIVLYVVSFYSVFYIFYFSKNIFLTMLTITVFSLLSGFGVTAGAHRLWAHKSYKATFPFRVFLALCFSMSGQNTLYQWVRDHRLHHKYSDTDADPHNVKRGFWFSHVGWLTMSRHPDVKEKGKYLPLEDLMKDPVVYYHQKFFWPLKIMLAFVLPTLVPIVLWNEHIGVAILSQCFFRYCFILNATWSVNSFAHIFGNKPYDKTIQASENKTVSCFALGEGWHNYHHAFPYDYKTSEFGDYSTNLTALLLDAAANYGWVYDRKYPSEECIRQRMKRTGDGTVTEEMPSHVIY